MIYGLVLCGKGVFYPTPDTRGAFYKGASYSIQWVNVMVQKYWNRRCHLESRPSPVPADYDPVSTNYMKALIVFWLSYNRDRFIL